MTLKEIFPWWKTCLGKFTADNGVSILLSSQGYKHEDFTADNGILILLSRSVLIMFPIR